jgi:DNA-binding NarL/FixJ family response regulator
LSPRRICAWLGPRPWTAPGRANPEIARALVVAPSTVKTHVTNLLGKLGAGNRVQAVTRARDLGLL